MMRFKRFRDARRAATRRRVIAAALVACLGLTVASSAASAATAPPTIGTCNGVAYSAPEALLACFIALANQTDFDSKGMKVGAPSSVIGSTVTEMPNPSAPESPTRRVADVNRWRANPQAWIDAKSRLSTGSGLTSRDVAETGRWKPKLTKGTVPVGKAGVGLLKRAGGVPSMLAFAAVDGLIVPSLESGLGMEGAVDSYWCSQRAAGRVDLVGYLVTQDCSGWEAAQDAAVELEASTASMSGRELCYPGGCYVLKVVTNAAVELQKYGYSSGSSARGVGQICYTRTGSANSAYVFVADLTRPGGGVKQVAGSVNGGTWVGSCNFEGGDLYNAFVGNESWPVGSYAAVRTLRLVDQGTGQVMGSVDAEPGPAEWITQVKCLDGTTRYAVSDPFDFEQGGMMPEPAAVDLVGCTPVETSVGIQDAGTGTTGWTDSKKVAGEEVSTEVKDWMTTYPQCMDGSCLLELRKVIGDVELDCFMAPDQCVQWQKESSEGTATYRCYYADTLVDLSECRVYGPTFEREKVQQGTGYADPATGEPAPQDPTGKTQTTNPGAAAVGMSTPVADPQQSRQCWPEGWAAFNPFEWVFQPVKCALEWAFVPRQTKIDQVQTSLKLAATNSKPAEVLQVVRLWSEVVPAGSSGCTGPEVRFAFQGVTHYVGYPFQACEGPMADVASMTRIALSISFVLFGLAAITRYLGRVFGFTGLGGGLE